MTLEGIEAANFSTDNYENNSEILYEDNEDFNLSIDEEYDVITICSSDFQPSKILYELDKTAYQNALQEHRENERERFRQIVLDEFPTPIACNFHKFERGYDNEIQRLFCLRDIWESIVFLIYAIVVGEFRCSKLSMDGAEAEYLKKINIGVILSDSIHKKLSIIEALLKLSLDKKIELSSLKIIPLELISKLKKLNQLRNSFSHTGAMSEERAKNFVYEHQEKVIDVLQDCKEFRTIKLLRFKKTVDSLNDLKFELFKGFSMSRIHQYFPLTDEQIKVSTPYLNKEHILVDIDNHIFSISPFCHFKLTDSGSETRLCFYKKQIKEKELFMYEIIGDGIEIELESKKFKKLVDEIDSLILKNNTTNKH